MNGTLVIAGKDPMSDFVYSLTGGAPTPLVIAVEVSQERFRKDLLRLGVNVLRLPLTAGMIDGIARIVAKRKEVSLPFLTFDPAGRCVSCDGKSIPLSKREFALLRCLSLESPSPASARDLVHTVWGELRPELSARQLLEYYVSQLRKKIRRSGLRLRIKTIRGVGYQLIAAEDAGKCDELPLATVS
jgi:DNA-binding response OmpR family regulator